MNTGKNRVKGLKTELFKKKFQTGATVENPTVDIQGQSLTNIIGDQTRNFEEQLKKDALYRQQFPLRLDPQKTYTAKEIERLKKNFPMTGEDFLTTNSYGIAGLPDLTAGQGLDDMRNQDQVLGQTEQLTSTPASLRNFQNPEFNQRVQDAVNAEGPSWLSQAWDATKQFAKDTYGDTDWRDVVRAGVGLYSAGRGIYEDARGRQQVAERIQNLNDQPRYMPNEYEYMARPGSQSVIYAKHGAQIRTGTESGAEEAELERGEMFMLPNMDTYHVGGKKHSQGGEDFLLPEGTIVFSDHLKVPGSRKTFADEAKKYDIAKYKETLENPHSKAVDRTTAEVMMDRNLKKLQELFQMQQTMNGNSNGELKTSKRVAQAGMFNLNGAPLGDAPFTPEQSAYNRFNRGSFNPQPVPQTPEQKKQQGLMEYTSAQVEEAEKRLKTKEAAKAQANPSGTLGAEPTPKANTASQQVGANDADVTEAGTVSKTNASDPTSMYYETLPNGKRVFRENRGEFEGKMLRDQYGNNPFNLVRNRLNEHEGLSPLLLSAYQMQLKNKNLTVGSADELVDIMESGNESLVAMRNFYKSIGAEDALFDPNLDLGKDQNAMQKKTAELFKQYVESPQYLADVKAGKASPYIPWLKTQPTEVKDKNGNVVGYKMDAADMDHDFVEKYQASYKAFGGVKKNQKSRGKDDMLRGYRIDPEGLSDHQWMGLPISPVDRWGGNTTIGQISAFEDEEIPKKKTPEKEGETITTAEGQTYNVKVGPAPEGSYKKAPFDYPQLAGEVFGLASSQMFPYAPMDYNAPYIMPQTLNIQPQLQDVDSSYMAAINAGADPNAALIATLGAKQKLYSEKQNFDAQQRAQADQYNANARWQEDLQDMASLDKVYNTLIAKADDAVTAQRQALVNSASKKRAIYNMEENKKALYLNNFVRTYKVDGKTGAITLDIPEGYDPIQLDPYGGNFALYAAQQAQIQAQAQAQAKGKKSDSTTTTTPSTASTTSTTE